MFFTWSDDTKSGTIDSISLTKKPKLGFKYSWFHIDNTRFLYSEENKVSRSMDEKQIEKAKKCYQKTLDSLVLVD